MRQDVLVPVGEYLGVLPYKSADPVNFEAVATVVQAGRLLRLPPETATVLTFVRGLRTVEETEAWIREDLGPDVVADLDRTLAEGLVRRGPRDDIAAWLGDCVLRPSGHSLGFVEDKPVLQALDGTAFEVTPVYFWVWVYLRTGQTLNAVVTFVRERVGIDEWSDAELSAALMHMLAHELAHVDAAA